PLPENVRRRLRPGSAHPGDLQDAQEPQVVHLSQAGYRERPVRVRPERKGEHRAVPGHRRAPLQAAERRPGERQQPRGSYVAIDGPGRFAALDAERLRLWWLANGAGVLALHDAVASDQRSAVSLGLRDDQPVEWIAGPAFFHGLLYDLRKRHIADSEPD